MARLCLLLGLLCLVGISTQAVTTIEPNSPLTEPASHKLIITTTPTTAPADPKLTTDYSSTVPATTAATTISPMPTTAAAPALTTAPSTKAEPAVTSKGTQTTPALQGTPDAPPPQATPAAAGTPDTITSGGTTPQPGVSTLAAGTAPASSNTTATPGRTDEDKATTAKDDSTPPGPLPRADSQTTIRSSASITDVQTTSPSPVVPELKDSQTPPLSSSSSPTPDSGSLTSTPASIEGSESTASPKQFHLATGATSPVPANPDTQHTVVVKYEENIEVQCNNKGSGDKLVKIHLKASRICNNTLTHTNEEHGAFKNLCEAVMPGYQQKKHKCTVQLGRGDSDEVPIIAAIVETQLSPEDLYSKLKGEKKLDSSSLFSYQSATLEDPDVVSIPLISAIVSLAVVLLISAAIYGCWHQSQTRKREQRLTEELQTMENGYHDNPTLEVMETAPEMQEKKGGPNGELGDSWIVPLDNLTGDELLDEEEDTHL